MSDATNVVFRSSKAVLWVVLALLAAAVLYAGAMGVANWSSIAV